MSTNMPMELYADDRMALRQWMEGLRTTVMQYERRPAKV